MPPVCPASCGLQRCAAVVFRPRCGALPPRPAWRRPPAPPSPPGSSPAVSPYRWPSPASRHHACLCRKSRPLGHPPPRRPPTCKRPRLSIPPQDVVLRHEVPHIRRQKQRLIDIPGAKVLAHSPSLKSNSLGFEQRLLGQAPSPSCLNLSFECSFLNILTSTICASFSARMMAVPKNDKYQGLRALRRALFEHGGLDKGSGIALHSTRNGRRMAKTSGRNSAPS